MEAAIPTTGRELSRVLRRRPASWRARHAAGMVRGEVVVGELTQTQAAHLCRVNVGNVSVALGNKGKRGPRDRTIDKVVKRYGVGPLMAGCDRATAPTSVAAE
jgi:hypothetical protein